MASEHDGAMMGQRGQLTNRVRRPVCWLSQNPRPFARRPTPEASSRGERVRSSFSDGRVRGTAGGLLDPLRLFTDVCGSAVPYGCVTRQASVVQGAEFTLLRPYGSKQVKDAASCPIQHLLGTQQAVTDSDRHHHHCLVELDVGRGAAW